MDKDEFYPQIDTSDEGLLTLFGTEKNDRKRIVLIEEEMQRINIKYIKSPVRGSFYSKNADDLRRVYNFIVGHYPYEKIVPTIESIKYSVNLSDFEEEDLNWLLKNDRACYWFYMTIKNLTFTINEASTFREVLYYPHTNAFHCSTRYTTTYNSQSILFLYLFPTKKQVTDTQSRFNEIKNIFNKWEESDFLKTKLLEALKEEWRNVHLFSPFEGFNYKNKEHLEWIEGYMSKSGFYFSYSGFYSEKDKFFQFQSMFDLWKTTAAEKQLFVQRLRRAWSQKNFRASVQDKSSLNTFISKKSKDRLKNLASDSNLSMSNYLEKLINDAYNKR